VTEANFKKNFINKIQMKTYFFTLMILIGSININAQIASSYLDINNIKVKVNAEGTISQFEAPTGTGIKTIFSDNLWIGGLDDGNQLKIGAQTYRQNGTDFWPGPLDSIGNTTSNASLTWNQTWKLKKCDIDNYHQWIINGMPNQNPIDSITTSIILNWPTVSNYGYSLAPYFDYNNDGLYDPMEGDFPKIKGDEAIFFVYNDKEGLHTETGGAAIGLEIQTMMYAYNCPDSALQNTVFINYKIFNRSHFNLNNTFIGKWTDFDIGNGGDDYVGSDVARGAYYGYNADTNDNNGYGIHPASQGVVFLKGVFADSNSIDDSENNTANGNGYGDGIMDNEELGMTRFMCYNNDANQINGNPSASMHYYNYLTGYWKNGSHWTYGGNGTSTALPDCNYIYPGDSDPNSFGTNGIQMPVWDEESAGNPAEDVRGMAATGPFIFQPGAMKEFEVAYVFGRDYSTIGAAAGVVVMKERIDSIKTKYAHGITSCSNNVSTGINTNALSKDELKLYPNPATDLLTIDLKNEKPNRILEIYNTYGQLVLREKLGQSLSFKIEISNLPRGLYILKIKDRENMICRKFIKD
jgi:hypothetical protein